MRLRSIAMLVFVFVLTCFAPSAPAQETHWGANYFPNVVLRDQNGRSLRFYDDVLRGKVVSINFIYTDCGDICPLDTAQLRQMQEILGDRVGRDIFMYSISLNPDRDTPETLRRFMRQYDIGPGWSFLTGSEQDVVRLQRLLGIRPVDQNDLASHETSIVLGNERTGQWIKRSAYENPHILAEVLGRQLSNYASRGSNTRQSYTGAQQVTDTSQGYNIFRTRCQACHTMGGGDRLGPDLRGVVSARPDAWLRRWIKEPDEVLAARDPTATALLARYRNLPMPNLGLSDVDVDAVIDYMRRQDEQAAAVGHH